MVKPRVVGVDGLEARVRRFAAERKPSPTGRLPEAVVDVVWEFWERVRDPLTDVALGELKRRTPAGGLR